MGFVQTHDSCVGLCQGELQLQLSVKLITYFSMLLVVYMLVLVLACLECTNHAKIFSQTQLVFSYVFTPMKVVPASLT